MIISNSDIMSFQKCERRFYYERILELRPQVYPEAMEIGTFGHKLFEVYFGEIMDGGTTEDAATAAGLLLMDAMDRPERVKVFRHVIAFGDYVVNQQEWKIVAIEDSKIDPVVTEDSDDLEFGYTPDLVVEFTKGHGKGQLALIDYKFTGQYWNDREVQMNQQLPKYAIYLRKNHGLKIRHAGYILLNTRATADATGEKLFLMKWVNLDPTMLANIEQENEVMMRRIAPYFDDPDWAEKNVVRTVDKMQCKMCWFADDLCPADRSGKDTSKIKERNYIQNDYGYSKDEVIVP